MTRHKLVLEARSPGKKPTRRNLVQRQPIPYFVLGKRQSCGEGQPPRPHTQEHPEVWNARPWTMQDKNCANSTMNKYWEKAKSPLKRNERVREYLSEGRKIKQKRKRPRCQDLKGKRKSDRQTERRERRKL